MAFRNKNKRSWNLSDIDCLPVPVEISKNYFGDGSDGDVTISTDTQLPSVEDGDMIVKNYNNLTIDAGATLTVVDRCRGALLFVDGDLTLNGDIDMSARGCHANPATSMRAGWIDVATDGYTPIGDMTGGGGLAYAFNGITVATAGTGAYIAGTTGYCGVDFGASKKIYKAIAVASSDNGFNDITADVTITLQGSTNNSTWIDLDNSTQPDAALLEIEFNNNNDWEYRYYRVKIYTAGSGYIYLSELKMFGESTTYHELETPVAPGDGHAVDANGIQIPFITDGDSDALVCHFEGCGTDAYALNALFPIGTGRLISIPRVGGAGGAKPTVVGTGINGNAGINGQTGGGGSAGVQSMSYHPNAGTAGTCFSGGVASGAADASAGGIPPQSYGGKGGTPYVAGYRGAGAGNPHGDNDVSSDAQSGTGALLIIICSGNVIGSGFLKTNGVKGGSSPSYGAGGATGGGCIVLATKQPVTGITLQVNGGIGGVGSSGTYDGGDGGAGSIITIGDLK